MFGFHFFSCNKKGFFKIILWKCIFHREIMPKLFFPTPTYFFCIALVFLTAQFLHDSSSSECIPKTEVITLFTCCYLSLHLYSGAIFLEIIELLLLPPRILEASLNPAWHSSLKDQLLQYSIAILRALVLCQHTHTCLPLVWNPFCIYWTTRLKRMVATHCNCHWIASSTEQFNYNSFKLL